MDTMFPCSATNSSSCSCRLGVIQERTPLIRFSRVMRSSTERKTPRDGTGTETARGEAPWQGGGEGDHGGDAHAAFRFSFTRKYAAILSTAMDLGFLVSLYPMRLIVPKGTSEPSATAFHWL